MTKLNIYGHGGSTNHGNEAIVRGFRALFPEEKISLFSFLPESDKKFGLDEVIELKDMRQSIKRFSLDHFKLKINDMSFNNDEVKYSILFKPLFNNVVKGELYILEAGDQYCENDDHRKMYSFVNKKINELGGKTIMLGCTINPEFLSSDDLIEDLNNYSLIVARESITYNALLKSKIKTSVYLAPDVAFLMKPEEISLPNIFDSRDVVGINTGFLKQGNEVYYEALVENTVELVEHIIKNTDYNIALIPHVNWNNGDADYKTLEIIKQKFLDSDRIEIIPENSAPKQKFIMSQCRFMVALRTHVSIPSIAAQVPTLITGYKVKSTGIFYDIFPENFELLAHVQSIETNNEFVKKFIWMIDNESEIREYMKKEIPKYISKTEIIRKEILKLLV